MPIAKGGREPKYPSTVELSAHVLADLLGIPHAAGRSRVPLKTSATVEAAQLLTQRGDHRVLVVDADPQPFAAMADTQNLLDELGQSYKPILLDCPPGSGLPASAEVWEEARRTLGLDSPDRPAS
ncbi:ParA family protein [Streptomyces sp. NPDC046275]|uniref:ParA family protein n=1 Tax=Streptomyces sp. NPDC046275 TaxID=3157201 RepID=UPI0033CF3B10